ncbi:CoA transferase [Tropicimonas sediminicola]|uniref:CoA-transferase family III n=1 Tax=Tropicimonas sediminicola TaxID=1031541 RepID=A0A239KPS3_9RHOB|nr:CoA transferase [Tropicimonas sediminicola]SNT20161.1 CoA-transferase family III [Tropicimonas sediminicola]
MTSIRQQIAKALGPDLPTRTQVAVTGEGALPSCFDVTGLALASMEAAAAELGDLLGAQRVALNRRRALMWFDMTLRPEGWELPGAWDSIAGNYRAADGWIRLHTNAPRHRAAALSVLGCTPEREAVARGVRHWDKDALETAVVTAGGAAGAMRGLADWARHPQGRAVAGEPLVAWAHKGDAPGELRLDGLRVLDLTRVLAGPVATRFLAGFGANVLRIDPPDWNEPGVEPEVTLGKRCAGLDLKLPADRARFETLLRSADVLVHGYRPEALDRLGFGAERRRSLAPAVIEVTLDAFGWTGPWAGRRGFDSVVQMSCGLADEGMRQAQADRPVALPVQALDHATGYLMAAAVLRALRIRNDCGQALSARLSLARTAHLLVSAGLHSPAAPMPPENYADLAPETEATGWGPASRIAFPVEVDGNGPRWRYPAGPLRRYAAE